MIHVEPSKMALALGRVAVSPVENPTIVEADDVSRDEREAKLELGVGAGFGEALQGGVGPRHQSIGHVGKGPNRMEGPERQR